MYLYYFILLWFPIPETIAIVNGFIETRKNTCGIVKTKRVDIILSTI